MNKRVIIIVSVILAAGALVIGANLIKKLSKERAIQEIKAQKSASISSLTALVKEFEAKNNLSAAKGVYQKLINEFSGSPDIMSWQRKIEEINMKVLFSPALSAGSVMYEIKPGDTLIGIAKEHKTTVELIKKSNGLLDDKITPGRKIKVWNSPFTIFVDKSQNMLILKNNEEVIKTYIVSTGKNNSTPAGSFKITNKLANPTWFKAGAVVPADSPENILGTRWLGFDIPGYGIHGTTEPQNLGKQVTQGCVRMSNPEVEELYAIVPVGAEVAIVD